MRRVVLFIVKAVHTVAFWVIASSIALVLVDGLRGRPGRRTAIAAGIAVGESVVFAANGFVCPLTPLAQRFGAARGSVSDVFLPDIVARNLTWSSSLVLATGLVLNARALRRRAR